MPGSLLQAPAVAVIPVGDRNPAVRTPWVTWALVAANVGVFVFLSPWAGGPCEQQRFFLTWGAVPAELTTGSPLGAADVAAVTPAACGVEPVAAKPVYLAALTSLFLHAGWVHLLGNMLYLWIFGNNIEDRLGHVRYLAYYLLWGLLATAAFVVPNAGSRATLVGASGAIAGVLGAYLVLFPTARVTVLVPFLLFLPVGLPAVVVLGLWFLLQLEAVGVAAMSGSNVAYLAHAGGFAAGAVSMLVGGWRRRGHHSR